MKVKDIYKASVMLVTAAADMEEYQEIALDMFNICLGRCFQENNHLREYKGKSKLENIPQVSSLDEDMPYEDEFATGLKYGLAAEIMIADADMDEGKHSAYMQLFTTEVNKWASKGIEESVEDVYATD